MDTAVTSFHSSFDAVCINVCINLVATHTLATSILLTWDQPSDDRVDYYLLSATYRGTCVPIETPAIITIGGAGREYSLTDLRENGVYKIELEAVNVGGKSQAAVLLSKTTTSLPTSGNG